MTAGMRRAGVAALAVLSIILTAGCESESDDAEVEVGCGLVPKSVLATALGSENLASTGSDKPDPETKLTSCTTSDTLTSGVWALVEVSDATPASLTARDNWRSASPEANPGCADPSFVNTGDLGGVACVEAAADGEATRLYVVSPTHIISVTLALAAEAAPKDTDAALKIAQTVEKQLA